MRKLSRNSKLAKPKEKSELWIRREVYGNVPEEYHFVLSNGEKLKDLRDLVNTLEKMPEDVFRHHVNEMRNDFSNWVKDVFKDSSLAEELKRMHSKMETELALQKYINKKLDKLVNKLAMN